MVDFSPKTGLLKSRKSVRFRGSLVQRVRIPKLLGARGGTCLSCFFAEKEGRFSGAY